MAEAAKTRLRFFSPNLRTNYEILRRRPPLLESQDQQGELDFVILHGWHSLYHPMLHLEKALRELRGGDRVRFWQVTYDSHWRPFTQSSREVVKFLRSKGVRPGNSIVLGFSMGGIVARGMVDAGFRPRHTFCVCSPHLGPSRWMPVADLGSISISRWSGRLAALNASPRDKAQRENCSLYGVSFQDSMGHHAHDRVVDLRSALAEGLPGFAVRREIKLQYKGVASGCDPHVQGMLPQNLTPLLEECEGLFAGNSEVTSSLNSA